MNHKEIAAFTYAAGKAPDGYECTKCGARGCKLWREYNACADYTKLFCGACALKDQKKAGPIDEDGYIRDKDLGGQRCDQIGFRVPAVPTENGETFWGYTSVPPDGVKWWRALPTSTRWSVEHHLPGRRNGCIMIKRDGENIAKMCEDTPRRLALAKLIVEALNEKERAR